VVTACATTGETWVEGRERAADAKLFEALTAITAPVWRMVGYSPLTRHEEPGWAASLPVDLACDIGRAFVQDAIYYVRDDVLWVTHCDDRRALVPICPFRDRPDLGPA